MPPPMPPGPRDFALDNIPKGYKQGKLQPGCKVWHANKRTWEEPTPELLILAREYGEFTPFCVITAMSEEEKATAAIPKEWRDIRKHPNKADFTRVVRGMWYWDTRDQSFKPVEEKDLGLPTHAAICIILPNHACIHAYLADLNIPPGWRRCQHVHEKVTTQHLIWSPASLRYLQASDKDLGISIWQLTAVIEPIPPVMTQKAKKQTYCLVGVESAMIVGGFIEGRDVAVTEGLKHADRNHKDYNVCKVVATCRADSQQVAQVIDYEN